MYCITVVLLLRDSSCICYSLSSLVRRRSPVQYRRKLRFFLIAHKPAQRPKTCKVFQHSAVVNSPYGVTDPSDADSVLTHLHNVWLPRILRPEGPPSARPRERFLVPPGHVGVAVSVELRRCRARPRARPPAGAMAPPPPTRARSRRRRRSTKVDVLHCAVRGGKISSVEFRECRRDPTGLLHSGKLPDLGMFDVDDLRFCRVSTFVTDSRDLLL